MTPTEYRAAARMERHRRRPDLALRRIGQTLRRIGQTGAPCRPRWGPPHPIGRPRARTCPAPAGTGPSLPSTSCATPSRPARSGCWSRYCRRRLAGPAHPRRCAPARLARREFAYCCPRSSSSPPTARWLAAGGIPHDRDRHRHCHTRLGLVVGQPGADRRRPRRWFYWTHRAHTTGAGSAPCMAATTSRCTRRLGRPTHPSDGRRWLQAAFLPLFLLVVPVHGAVITVFLVHYDPAQPIGQLRVRAVALALDPARLARLDHAGQPPSLPPRPQPRQLRPVILAGGTVGAAPRMRLTCGTAMRAFRPAARPERAA